MRATGRFMGGTESAALTCIYNMRMKVTDTAACKINNKSL
jgi:hypothetical protein